MKKLLWLIPLIALFLMAEPLFTGLQTLYQSDGTLFADDTLAGTDTVYTKTYSLSRNPNNPQHSGYIVVEFDVTLIGANSTSVEVFLQEGMTDGDWDLVTQVCSVQSAATWDTIVELGLLPTRVCRLGITNLNGANDSLIFENLRTFAMPH